MYIIERYSEHDEGEVKFVLARLFVRGDGICPALLRDSDV